MPHSKNSGSSPTWLRGCLAACLVLSLSACEGTRLLRQTKVEPQYPPRSLVLQTPRPPFLGGTNADLLQWALNLRDALGSCNADKGAIETWATPSGAP